jgi:hypothetical protein
MANNYKGGVCKEGDGGKPSLGFSVSAPMKAGHGHFAQEKFLREGHNTVPKRSTPLLTPEAAGVRTAADKLRGNVARQVLRGSTTLARASAADVRAERPVLAAKVDRRQAVKAARASGGDVKAARAAGRQAVAAARTSMNAAGNERTLRRQARKAAY